VDTERTRRARWYQALVFCRGICKSLQVGLAFLDCSSISKTGECESNGLGWPRWTRAEAGTSETYDLGGDAEAIAASLFQMVVLSLHRPISLVDHRLCFVAPLVLWEWPTSRARDPGITTHPQQTASCVL
jgi:hypothetical protein